MDGHKRVSVLFLALPLLLGACLSLKQPSNKIEFYTLEYDPPRINRPNPLPFVIRVERFSVAPLYNTNRIIYRDRSFKREAYVYYRWRVNPGDLVTYFLTRDIKESGLFKAVLPHDSGIPASHVLEGSVDEFFELDTKESWKAVLSVSIILMAENEPDITKGILFQKTYRATETCKQKNPRALAEAMSKAMARVSRESTEDTYAYLKDRK